MNRISVSQIKINPSRAIAQAQDLPVAVEVRNKVQAYILGKDLYTKLMSYIEEFIDRKAIATTDFKKGKKFEKVAAELGI